MPAQFVEHYIKLDYKQKKKKNDRSYRQLISNDSLIMQKKYENKDVPFWNNIILSGESKFDVIGQKK